MSRRLKKLLTKKYMDDKIYHVVYPHQGYNLHYVKAEELIKWKKAE